MKYLLNIFLILMPVFVVARQSEPQKLDKALKLVQTDSAKAMLLRQLGFYYLENNPSKSIYYWDQSISIAQKNDKVLDEAFARTFKAYELSLLGKYPESFQYLQQALKQTVDEANETKTWNLEKSPTLHINRLSVLAQVHQKIGILMELTNNIDQEIVEYNTARVLCAQTNDAQLLGLVNMNLGGAYLKIGNADLALRSFTDAELIFRKINFLEYIGSVYLGMGNVYLKQGNNQLALQYFYKTVRAAQQHHNTGGLNLNGVNRGYRRLTDYFLALKQPDSSLHYAVKTLQGLRNLGSKDLGNAYENLYKSYQLKHYNDSAYKYQGMALAAKDSSYKASVKNLADFQKLSFNEQLRAQQLEKEKEDIQTRNRTYLLMAGIGMLLILALIFYINNRQKHKANVVLAKTLSNLQAAQSQLIQSEKMASLGELTAGIAHEIQNPLNFVNNFSEVNTELLEELKAESKRPKAERDWQQEFELIDDLIENEKKINHHGKRADSIVKGMLEHSRSSSGKKEPTDINALADEYLRLSYHGLRAKDKSFNAELVANFDTSLPKINVIPQDMGRVFLNLFNNAFYAVQQKVKTTGADYKPTIEVETFYLPLQGVGGLKVRDNGVGIPDAIKEKIMQPFFTTKPTGEGTWLGLSLTYDMVVKGHGGSVQVNSIYGEGSEFIISIPFV